MYKKNKAGYSCKIYEGIEVCGCAIKGKIAKTFDTPKPTYDDAENYFKVVTVVGKIYIGRN